MTASPSTTPAVEVGALEVVLTSNDATVSDFVRAWCDYPTRRSEIAKRPLFDTYCQAGHNIPALAGWLHAARAGSYDVGTLLRVGPLKCREELMEAIVNHPQGLSRDQWIWLCGAPWFATRAELEKYPSYQLERLGYCPHQACLDGLKARTSTVATYILWSSVKRAEVTSNSIAQARVTIGGVMDWPIEDQIRHYSG